MHIPPFLKDLAERAVKTFCQSALATIGLGSVDVLHTNWFGVLSVGLGAAIISVLTSIASLPVGTPGTASAVKLLN